jgi:hypothetical protein
LSVIYGMNEDVKNLSSTLSIIKAVLEDAENKQRNDPQLKIIDIMKFRSATTTEEEIGGLGIQNIFFLSLSKLQAFSLFFFFVYKLQLSSGKARTNTHGEKSIWVHSNFLYHRLPWRCLLPVMYSC